MWFIKKSSIGFGLAALLSSLAITFAYPELDTFMGKLTQIDVNGRIYPLTHMFEIGQSGYTYLSNDDNGDEVIIKFIKASEYFAMHRDHIAFDNAVDPDDLTIPPGESQEIDINRAVGQLIAARQHTFQGMQVAVLRKAEGKPMTEIIEESDNVTQGLIEECMERTREELEMLHSSNILHLDVNPGNVLFTITDHDCIPSFIDFGRSIDRDSEKTTALHHEKWDELVERDFRLTREMEDRLIHVFLEKQNQKTRKQKKRPAGGFADNTPARHGRLVFNENTPYTTNNANSMEVIRALNFGDESDEISPSSAPSTPGKPKANSPSKRYSSPAKPKKLF